MKSRLKQILAYILIITIMMGNTVSASAASVSGNGYEGTEEVTSEVQESVTEEGTEETTEPEITTEESTTGEHEDVTEPESTTEESAEETSEAESVTEESTTEESTTEENTSVEMSSEEETTSEDIAEETTEDLSSEAVFSEKMNEIGQSGEESGNVYLYYSETKEGEYSKAGSFTSLQDALDAIDILAVEDYFYKVEMVCAEEETVTFSSKTLDMPRKTAGITIMAGIELTEPFIYLTGTLKLQSNVTFEDIIFVPSGKTVIALDTYEMVLSECRVDEKNGGRLNGITGSGTKGTSTLVLDDTDLHVAGAVNNVGTVIFAENGHVGARTSAVVPAVSSLKAEGKINVGNVELKTDGRLTGGASVTRGEGNITKITPQITIGGEVFSENGSILYLDLLEKVSGTYQRLDLDKEEADNILKKGIALASAKLVTYPHIKALQRNEAGELVKASGYLKYYDDGYGVVLSFEENGVEEKIPCYTFADAVTEINNRKTKQDYVITLTKDCTVISGTRQDISKSVPQALKMPDKKYVKSLIIQAQTDVQDEIFLGYTGNITLTSDTTLRNVHFVQVIKSGAKYVNADTLKDGFPAVVTLKTGGYDLTIEKQVTFNTPLILNGGNKGSLFFKEEGVIHTITNDWKPEKYNSDSVIFGSITGFNELTISGQDVTLNEYRSSRAGTKYTASVNKITSLSLTDSVFTVNGRNKTGSLIVKNLYVDNGEVLVGGKAEFTDVTLEGSQKALISADTVFTIKGNLVSRSNNATLLTRLKGAGKAPYLTINGKVIREEGALPVYIGVYPENKASEKMRSIPVELKNAPKVTAQLLTAKKALAVDFRPIAENYPWGSGQYSKDNTSGYMMMKSGNNVYVYEGSKVKVAVYEKEETTIETDNGKLFGFFSSIQTATNAVNKEKNKNAVYIYVLMDVNGTAASPVVFAMPSQAKKVIIKSLENCPKELKTITFSGNISLGAETVFEDVILAPVKKGKSTTFTISAKSKSLTLKNVDLPGSVTKAADLTVEGSSVVTGSVEAACLRILNDRDGAASTLSVEGNVKVTTLENRGEVSNILEYSRTSKNVTRLTINGQIINEYADKPVIIKQASEKTVSVLSKSGIKTVLKDANKLAVMPKASTDSFVLEASVPDAQGNVIPSQYLQVVKANKGIWLVDTRDVQLAGQKVTLKSVTENTETLTECLDYKQAVDEINNRADKTADYTIYFKNNEQSGDIDVNISDANKYSPFSLPKKNTKASLTIIPEGEAGVVIPFTGNVTGYGVVTLENLILQPVKGAANGVPVNTVFTVNADKTGASLHLNGITTKEQITDSQFERGYIGSIKGTKNKTEVFLNNCGNMLLTTGISNVKTLSIEDTKLLSAKNSAPAELVLGKNAAWISLGMLKITNVSGMEAPTDSYVGIRQDSKGMPQLSISGGVKEGMLLVRLYERDASVSERIQLFAESPEKEIDSYLDIPLAAADKADVEDIRAYAYRVVDENGTIASNLDGVSRDTFASYKNDGYVVNGTQETMFQSLGSVELLEEAKQAGEELEQLAQEKELYALIYMTDSYEVKEKACHESATTAVLQSGHTVQVLGMDVEWTHSSEWDEYIPIVWYYVQFYIGETLYKGYVEESCLAYSDELLLKWKEDWYMLFPAGNSIYAEYGASSYSDVEKFPTSYQVHLKKLKDSHPNWTFVPMNVGRNWEDCVNEQMGDYSWIYYNQPAKFRGAQINSTWYYASRAGIEYYMDPRNFLTESNIFQFEQNTYNASYHTQSALQNFLNGTFMAGKIPDNSQGRTYAYVIWNSGKSRGLSPFNLAARVIQEQGVNGTSAMISGTYSGYEGYYNHYNISASGTTNAEVIRNGLAYAKKMGWNTRTKSLDGGAAFVGNGYILKGQDTLYLQKFDIEHGNDSLHQYMQNIMAPYSEGRSMKSMYSEAGSLNSSFVFKIPVFDNMPGADYTLSPKSVKLEKGKTRQLTLKCSGVTISPDKAVYSSSNPEVATVSSSGLITAVHSGKAVITALVGEGEDKIELTCKVEVYAPLKSISLEIENDTLYAVDGLADKIAVLENGVTKYIDKEECPTETVLRVTYDPVDTTDSKKVTWTVENPDVVEVVQDPKDVSKAIIAAKTGGITKITAKVGKLTSTVAVTVRVPMTEASLKLDENNITMYKGEKIRVNVFYAPYETTDSIDPVWTSTNEEVVKVIDGDIVAVGTGNAVLYADVGPFVGSQEDVTGLSCQITVKEYTVKFMNPDDSVLLTATGEYGSSLQNLNAQSEIPWQQEKEGYIFAGWYTQQDGQGYAVTEQMILHGDMTLYPYFINIEDGFYAKPVGDVDYTGAYLKPVVEVYNGNALLVHGQDYSVVYINNKRVNNPADVVLRPTAIIYGKGIYSGKQYKAYFDIVPKDISHTDITAGNLLSAYTGKEQQMEPVLYDSGRTLQKDIDYTLTYPENDKENGAYSEAGSYEVTVTGMGNYTGSRVLCVTISKRTLMTNVTVGNIADMKFNNGTKYSSAEEIVDCIPKDIKITYNGSLLSENVDYTLQYENNREIGIARVIITGIGSYIGTKIKTFRITGTSMSTVTVKGISNTEYAAEPLKQDASKVRLTNKSGVILREGLDYELSYQNNTEAGRAYITFSGINGYTGMLKKTFVINPYDIARNDQRYQIAGDDGVIVEKPAFEIVMDDDAVEFDKAGVQKAVEVFFKGIQLNEGTDYKISYESDQAVVDEESALIVTGIGNYTGSVSKNFNIIQKDLTKINMTAGNVTFRNRKGFCFVEPVLTDESGRYLNAGTDYEEELIYTYEKDTVLYNGEQRLAGEVVLQEDIPKTGSVIRVTAVGKGNYVGSISCTFEVL